MHAINENRRNATSNFCFINTAPIYILTPFVLATIDFNIHFQQWIAARGYHLKSLLTYFNKQRIIGCKGNSSVMITKKIHMAVSC